LLSPQAPLNDSIQAHHCLKNGEILRGKYGLNSFASSYPSERQIYLEEVWIPDGELNFGEKVDRTRGVIVSQDEILYIKLMS